jgi:hypothetical protein
MVQKHHTAVNDMFGSIGLTSPFSSTGEVMNY